MVLLIGANLYVVNSGMYFRIRCLFRQQDTVSLFHRHFTFAAIHAVLIVRLYFFNSWDVIIYPLMLIIRYNFRDN